MLAGTRSAACTHSRPAGPQFASLKSRLATNITGIGLLDEQLKQALLGRLAGMPGGDRLCHGDFHPVNVLGQNSLPMVIDWPDACCGDPAADVCRSYLLLKLHAEDIAEPYLDAYCNITNTPRANILDWLRYVAAARLAEDVPDDWAKSVTMPQDDRAVLAVQRRRSSSISSSVRGQSSCIRRDSARSARSRPPVWQHAQ